MVMLAPQSVARRLRLSTSRVTQLDREGVLPAMRDSAGRRFWDAKVVERFALERERRGVAPTLPGADTEAGGRQQREREEEPDEPRR